MPPILVQDDGRTVTLDLHGRSVQASLRIVRRAIEASRQRGRLTMKIIHGQSTAGRTGVPSIKEALHEAVRSGQLGTDVTGHVDMGGYTVLAIAGGGSRDANRITAFDLD